MQARSGAREGECRDPGLTVRGLGPLPRAPSLCGFPPICRGETESCGHDPGGGGRARALVPPGLQA